MGRNMRDLREERFGKLVAKTPELRGGFWYWHCECDCGGRKVVRSGALTSPRGTRSCGCAYRNRPLTMSQKAMAAVYARRRKKILALRGKGMSWAAIARLMGVSRQRVQQIGAGTRRVRVRCKPGDAPCGDTPSTSTTPTSPSVTT
jgi:hypothetical protein